MIALKQRQKLTVDNSQLITILHSKFKQCSKATVGAFGIKGLQDFEKQVAVLILQSCCNQH
jgi:hypothetical protein